MEKEQSRSSRSVSSDVDEIPAPRGLIPRTNQTDPFAEWTVDTAAYLGRRVKQSPIPDAFNLLFSQLLILFRLLDRVFNLYENTVSVVQYITRFCIYIATVGVTASIQFLTAYHEVSFCDDEWLISADTTIRPSESRSSSSTKTNRSFQHKQSRWISSCLCIFIYSFLFTACSNSTTTGSATSSL